MNAKKCLCFMPKYLQSLILLLWDLKGVIILSDDFSCKAQATWPDGEKVLSYLKDVDHLGLTGEIRFDTEGFRTEIQLDLIEKVRGRFRKTATWTPENGVNYTLTSEEIGAQMIEKLANRTLRVVTTPVSERLCDSPLPLSPLLPSFCICIPELR